MENPLQKKYIYQVIEWLKANLSKKISTTARIYNLNPSCLRVAILRLNRKPRIQSTHGGHNMILSKAQSKVVIQYIQD